MTYRIPPMPEVQASVLWVSAHPDPASLTATLRDGAIADLRRRGVDVVESDLYRMGFEPLVSVADVSGAAEGPVSRWQQEATETGTLAPDIRAEQEKLRTADTVVLQFPLWWYGVPAILKGWIDRVFTNGFAFGVRDEEGKVRKYGDGGLAGKHALAVVAAGDRGSALGPRGVSGDLEDVLWPLLHGTLFYTGMAPHRPYLVPSADRVTAGDVSRLVDELGSRVAGLVDEEPLHYRSLRGGDYDDEHVLHPEVAPSAVGNEAHRRVASADVPVTSGRRDPSLR